MAELHGWAATAMQAWMLFWSLALLVVIGLSTLDDVRYRLDPENRAMWKRLHQAHGERMAEQTFVDIVAAKHEEAS